MTPTFNMFSISATMISRCLGLMRWQFCLNGSPSVLIGHVCLHLTSIFIPLDKKDGVNCRTTFLRCSAYGSERDTSCNLDSKANLTFSESLIPIEKSEYWCS